MMYEIFLPFWGDPQQLYETVDSVRGQTDPDWRLTIIDDCYPDESVAAYFAMEQDRRIRYIRNDHNLGITENFRECVRRATAARITILGSDDLLMPNYVALVRQIAHSVPEADVIQPGVDVIDQTGRRVLPLADRVKQRLLAPHQKDITTLRGQDMATSLIRGNWLYWPSLSLRVETVRAIGFRDDFPIILDLALLMDIAFRGGVLAYDPDKAFLYRRHSGSASQRTLLDGSRFRDDRLYFQQAREIAIAKGWRRTARAARGRMMSRFHGLATLPTVLGSPSREGVGSTLAHIFSMR
ncbi:glycosyltransferase [Microbacterium sp.]|uniref:glycosyltransferase n=1 Tax=Microbacterium sp. TaxID=51671 RepID=UPI003C72BEFE